MTDWVQQQMERIRKEQADANQKGGPGSGHFGHAGRPGKRGGSVPGKGGGGGASAADGATGQAKPAKKPDAKPTKKPKMVMDENGQWVGGDLPRDLTKLTEGQTRDLIRFFGKMPLKELRRRQDIVSAQQDTAY